MLSIYKHPKKLMDTLAQNIQKQTCNKLYYYSIFDFTHEGICIVKSVSYDSLFDYFIFCIEDVFTKNNYIIDRCNIYMKEIDVDQICKKEIDRISLKIIGKRIKQVRESKHMTQEELAYKLGMSSQHISVIERGIKLPRLETFIKIANILEVYSDTLLCDVINNPIAIDMLKNITSNKNIPEHSQNQIINIIKPYI